MLEIGTSGWLRHRRRVASFGKDECSGRVNLNALTCPLAEYVAQPIKSRRMLESRANYALEYMNIRNVDI